MTSGSEMGDNVWLALREAVDDLELAALLEAADEWIGLHSGIRDWEITLDDGELRDGLNGVALLLALEEATGGSAEIGSAEVADVRLRFRRAMANWLRGNEKEERYCSAVVIRTGDACTSRVHAEDFKVGTFSTCRRHHTQGLLSQVLAQCQAFPRFPSGVDTARVDRDSGGYEDDALVECTLCPRSMTASKASELATLGGPGDSDNIFSHNPSWVSEAAGQLAEPGATFCLVCVGAYPRACGLLAALRAVSTGNTPENGDSWVWGAPLASASHSIVAAVRRNCLSLGVALPASWTAVPRAAQTAMAVRTGMRRAKEGTNTDLRRRLAEQVGGAGLEGAFRRAAGKPGGDPPLGRNLSPGSDDGDRLPGLERELAAARREIQRLQSVPPTAPGPAGAAAAGGGTLGGLGATAGATQQCALAGCARPCYVEPSTGRIHDFCGQSHAREAAASGTTVAGPGTSIEIASLLDRLERIESSMTGVGPGFGIFASIVPVRPRGALLPSEADVDGFDVTHGAHQRSLRRCMHEDYLGALKKPKAYAVRRTRLVGTDRIDISSKYQHLPEEASGEMHVLEVGDTRIEGTSAKQGIPARGDFHAFQQARMTDLAMEWRNGEGLFGTSGEVKKYAEVEVRLMLGRKQYMCAVERVLTDELEVPFGVVWRYWGQMVVKSWQAKEVNEIDFNRDLLLYAMRAPWEVLLVRQAPHELMELASSRINNLWLTAAQRLADEFDAKSAGGGGGGGSGGGGGGGGGDRCSSCGGRAEVCGGYRYPQWSCTKAVQNVCPEKGCALRHLLRGTRSWTCKQAAAAKSVLSAEQLVSAFQTSFAGFIAGPHAKAAAVKAAASA